MKLKRIINKIRKVYFNKFVIPKLHKKYSAFSEKADCTIICNNCFGGMLYHDLGVKFFSPTINLFFEMDDYLEFVENLDYFLNCRLSDGGEYAGGGVIGILDNKIKIIGIHYKSFDELQDKWTERCKRVNRDNLFLIGIYRDGCNDEHVKRFCRLPYKNKKFLVPYNRHIDCENGGDVIVYMKAKDIVPGADIMASLHIRSYIKAFDFYDWLTKEGNMN